VCAAPPGKQSAAANEPGGVGVGGGGRSVSGMPGEVNKLARGVGVREGAVVDRGAEVCGRQGRSMPKEQ